MSLQIHQLIEQSYKTSVEKGWWHDDNGIIVNRNIGELLALIHSEVSEALEDWRNGKPINVMTLRAKDGKPEGFPSEMADIFIRVADMCGHFKINLESALEEKLAYNKTRPHRHGGKLA